MAAYLAHLFVFILLARDFNSEASVERRFSNIKRCADDECSMLVCRGKAVRDFYGTDCRFLTFKEGETIYVYYKLAGRRTDLWAGSVGSRFGYFPKDLLAINHIYTEKELEVHAQETDFVCFDTGRDQFDEYDVDSLLRSSLAFGGDKTDENKNALDQNESPESIAVEEEPSPIETLTEEQSDSDDTQGLEEDSLPDEEAADGEQGDIVTPDLSSAELERRREPTVSTKAVDSVESSVEPFTERTHDEQPRTGTSVSDAGSLHDGTKDHPSLEDDPLTKDDPDFEKQAEGFAEGRPIPELKTTLGRTFDAVTSDDVDTWKVTPYEEEESDEKVHNPSDDHTELSISKIPLLSSTAVLEHKDVPESEEEESSLETEQNGEPAPEDRNKSLGDKVFAIISGGERTAHESYSEEEEEEEEEEDEEEEMDSEPQSQDKTEDPRESIEPLATEPETEPQEPEKNKNSEELISDAEVELGEGDQADEVELEEGDQVDEEELGVGDQVDEEELGEGDQADEVELGEGDQADEVELEEGDQVDEEELGVGDQADEPSPSPFPADEERSSEQTEDALTASLTLKDDNPADQQSDLKPQPLKANVLSDDDDDDDDDLVEEVEEPNKVGLQVEQKKDTDKFREHDGVQNTTEESYEDLTLEEEEIREDLLSVDSEQRETKSREQPITDLEEEEEEEEEEPTSDSEQKQSARKQDANNFRKLREYLNTYLVKNTTDETIQKIGSAEELIDPEEEELLEDENAASSKIDGSQSRGEHVKDKETESSDTEPEMESEDLDHDHEELDTEPEMPEPDTEAEDTDPNQSVSPEEEPEYSDSVLRLTVLRNHFNEEHMKRFQKFLGLNNLFRVEVMFSDLEQELKAVRQSDTDNGEDIERALEIILEASETPILDEIERMLDGRDLKSSHPQKDTGMFDEEAAILDDFQELAFNLRQKYSAASDSTPLATESQVDIDTDGDISDITEEKDTLPNVPEDAVSDNFTVMENPPETKKPKEEFVHDEVHKSADMDIEDGGHFNKNKDNQPSFDDAEEIQNVPQPVLDSAFDIGLGVKTDPPSPGSFDSPSVSHFHEEGWATSAPSYVCSLLYLLFQYCGAYAFLMISVLPEEWKPGPTFLGLPWAPVVTTVLVGLFTTVVFLWRSILTVRKKVYLAGEKEMKEQLHKVIREKSDVLSKAAELERRGEELREQQRASAESASSALERVRELEKLLKVVDKRNGQLAEEKKSVMQVFDEERAKYLKYVEKSADFEKTISKLSRSLKKTQDTLAKSKVLMDEAKIREDARNVQHQCLEREYAAIKEQNSSLKSAAKDWEDRNRDLCEQIKVFQKSQKEFEDTIAQKDHSNEVLSELLVDLEAYDLQKGDARAVANGEAATVADKTTAVRNRIKQLMDVSRVQTTLTVVAEERDKFQARLEKEEKARKALEEKYQELEHNTTALKSDRGLIENQLKILQQKNEIMTEMYQQKEIALQKRLTNEELERRDKEMKLSEVDGKALETEQEVKVYRQRIKEMEEEVKKTEKALKVQIAEQERKAHENWVAANTAERSLSQEKTLTRTLREKLAALSTQLNDLRASNAGRSAVRRGDSYGPSPVSGGAPSPPLMMEAPGRCLSAPIGRRVDALGPRPLPEKHAVPSRSDSAAPRTSSPANMEDSQTAPAQSETLESVAQVSTVSSEPSSRPQVPGSFMESPIRDSPGPPMSHGPPLPGPRGVPPPPFGHGYRPPPPPSYLPPGIRQANGNEGMPGGDFRYRAHSPNGHPAMMAPRPRLPMPPPGMRFPPNLPPHHAPMYRGGPPGPYGPYHPDFRFGGPRDYPMPPPQHLPPPGALPPPPQGGFPHHSVHGPRDSFGGPNPGQGQGQDSTSQQAPAVQDSVRSAMAEP